MLVFSWQKTSIFFPQVHTTDDIGGPDFGFFAVSTTRFFLNIDIYR